MKPGIFIFFTVFVLIPGGLQAQPRREASLQRLETTLSAQTNKNTDRLLTQTDPYGTPYVLNLARKGEVSTLLTLAQQARSKQFLTARDAAGNNLLHVAKNAATVQAIASLVRHFYKEDAPQQITRLANARNTPGETPLHAQINAGHSDTFRLIYPYTTLKQTNDTAKRQLSRLRGSDPRIFAQHQTIYCNEVVKEASANGFTLLQAAQAQVPYNPAMAHTVEGIAHVLPCLVQSRL